MPDLALAARGGDREFSAEGREGAGGSFAARSRKMGATFAMKPGNPDMNTFLRILLLAVVALLAIKYSPLLLAAALIGLVVAAVLGVVGISLVTALVAIVLGLAVALAPIWVTALAIVGLISLFRKTEPAPAMVAS